jgi:hypothetical protein
VKATGRKFAIKSTNFHLGAMLLMPAAEKAEFDRAVDALRH